MSVHISSRAWKDQTTTGNARLLLLALADMANDAGVCWPSTNTLAERVNLQTERAVRKLLSELESAGKIRREMRPGHSTVYHVLMPDPGTVGQGVQPDRVSRGTGYPGTVGQGTPEQPDRVSRGTGYPGTVGQGTPEQPDRVSRGTGYPGTVGQGTPEQPDRYNRNRTISESSPTPPRTVEGGADDNPAVASGRRVAAVPPVFGIDDPLPVNAVSLLSGCPEYWEEHLRLALAGRSPGSVASYASKIVRDWRSGKNAPHAPLPKAQAYVPPPEPPPLPTAAQMREWKMRENQRIAAELSDAGPVIGREASHATQ